jgi:hypothetical protein
MVTQPLAEVRTDDLSDEFDGLDSGVPRLMFVNSRAGAVPWWSRDSHLSAFGDSQWERGYVVDSSYCQGIFESVIAVRIIITGLFAEDALVGDAP